MTGADHGAAISQRETYPGHSRVLTRVRADVASWLESHGFSYQVTERARLLVSELATNAIEAAPDRLFEVAVARSAAHTAVIAVTNHVTGSGPPPSASWGPPQPLAPKGRGLAIAAALAEEISVDTSSPGFVTIRASIVDQPAPDAVTLGEESRT
jgi:anti-sigma regulatory factor (Ser/Thr protein kinase)